MSLHERAQTVQIDAQRTEHHQRWEDEAHEQSVNREFSERLVGRGTVEAAHIMLKEAHKDNQILSAPTPEHK